MKKDTRANQTLQFPRIHCTLPSINSFSQIFLGNIHLLFLLPFSQVLAHSNAEVAHLVEHDPPEADGVVMK
jgi:hypothetical protein